MNKDSKPQKALNDLRALVDEVTSDLSGLSTNPSDDAITKIVNKHAQQMDIFICKYIDIDRDDFDMEIDLSFSEF